MFGEGDGSTTFNLPDLREVELTGAGTNSLLSITQHDAQDLGDFADDQTQAWQLGLDGSPEYWMGKTYDGYSIKDAGAGSTYALPNFNTEYQGSSSKACAHSDGTHGDIRDGYTTHGKIIACNWEIRY